MLILIKINYSIIRTIIMLKKLAKLIWKEHILTQMCTQPFSHPHTILGNVYVRISILGHKRDGFVYFGEIVLNNIEAHNSKCISNSFTVRL